MSCSGIAMHSLWSALEKRNDLYACIKSPVCPSSYIIYHHPVRYSGHIRGLDPSGTALSLDSASYQLAPSFWRYSFPLKRALMRPVSRAWGSRTAEGFPNQPSGSGQTRHNRPHGNRQNLRNLAVGRFFNITQQNDLAKDDR
jgi:hypothetical protein